MLSSLLLSVVLIAHDPGYSTSLAKHLQRWLASEQIGARVVTARGMSAALASERLAMLVGFTSPVPGEMQALRAFRQRGGRLVVFNSSSPALCDLMGVRPLGYVAAGRPGQWSRMVFDPSAAPSGAPRAIGQTSGALQRVQPVPGRMRTIATWQDRQGRATGDAAWLAGPAGWWMTHVLTADGDEALKSRLLASIVGAAEPGRWSLDAHNARAAQAAAAIKAVALEQTRRPGEIHAVWDHAALGLYAGNWTRTMAELKASRVTDLFVNVAGAGFAHYPSAVLPRSKTCALEGDQLAACLAAARGTGIRVHAWILCFTGARSEPAVLEDFRRRGWRLKTPNGKLTEYLDPANPSVRARLLSAIDEIQTRYPVQGIQLDFVRWYERAAKPKNAAAVITAFVAEARRHVKRPRWLTTAVLGRYPSCVASVGQNWTAWIDSGLVDYVVPMDYTASPAKFEELVAQHGATRAHAAHTIAGIGVTANESRLDARQVIGQIRLSRKYALAGNALFDLDATLEKDILPYLRLGIW